VWLRVYVGVCFFGYIGCVVFVGKFCGGGFCTVFCLCCIGGLCAVVVASRALVCIVGVTFGMYRLAFLFF